MRVVFDTNVLVSAICFPHSKPRRALDYVIDNGYVMPSSAAFSELQEVLHRPKFDKILDRADRLNLLAFYGGFFEFVHISESILVCRDPDDNIFLEIAISGDADYLVTGDDDLITLHPFRGLAILYPATFLEVVPGVS